MKNYINKQALPVTFWQRNQSGTWKSYSIPAYVIKDISTFEGLREVTFTFLQDPTDIGYYPRQNDILVPAVDMTDPNFKGFGLSWTTPYFKDDFLDNTNLGNGVLFLSSISNGNYKFVPLFGVDEETLFLKGNYKKEYVVNECGRSVWNRLVSGHPFLKTIPSSYTYTSYDSHAYSNYDNVTILKLSEVWQELVAGIGFDFDVTFQVFQNSDQPFKWSVINRNGASDFNMPVNMEKVTAYAARSRNSSEGNNIVEGYNQTTGAFYKYAWLDKNGNIQLGTTIPTNGSTVRMGYTELQDSPTDGELRTRASTMLTASIYHDYEEVDFKIDMGYRYEIGTRNNPSLPPTSVNKQSTVYLNSMVGLIGYRPEITYTQVREIDLLGGYIIVGVNDDITLGE